MLSYQIVSAFLFCLAGFCRYLQAAPERARKRRGEGSRRSTCSPGAPHPVSILQQPPCPPSCCCWSQADSPAACPSSKFPLGKEPGCPLSPPPRAPLTVLPEEQQETGWVPGLLANLALPASRSLWALEVHLQLGAQVLRRIGAPGPLDQQREEARGSHPQRCSSRLDCGSLRRSGC